LLDADDEGKNQKQRYIDEFGPIIQSKIFTLGDINTKWDINELKIYFANVDKTNLQKYIYPTEIKYNKKHFNKSIQEVYIKNEYLILKSLTKNNFEKLLDFIKDKN